MPTLFIHIGTHKTGTTAFQQLIFKEKFKLAKKDKLYVINLQKFPQMQELMVSEAYNPVLVENFSSFLKKRIIKKQGRYLASHEGLSGNPDQLYRNNEIVAQMLHDATMQYETNIIVLLRRQDEFIQSVYTQKIHEGNTCKIEDFLARKITEHLDWNIFLQPYINFFGGQNVHAYPYDRSVLAGKSIAELINMTLRSTVLNEVGHIQNKNAGYSRSAMNIAGHLNARLTPYQKRYLRLALQEVSIKKPLVEYNILAPEQKRAIVEHFTEPNRVLAKRYFPPDFNMMNYSDPVFESENEGDGIEETYANLTVQLLKEIEISMDKIKKDNPNFLARSSRKAYSFCAGIYKRLLYNLD